MADNGGDREYPEADSVTMTFDNANSGVSTADEGMAVGITGDLTFDLSDSGASIKANGVLSDSVDNGEKQTVHLHGAVWTRVASGDNVSAGDTVGAGTTNGVLTTGGSEYDVLVGETTIDGEAHALVYLD